MPDPISTAYSSYAVGRTIAAAYSTPEPVSTTGVPVMPTFGRILPHGSEPESTGSARWVCQIGPPLLASMA